MSVEIQVTRYQVSQHISRVRNLLNTLAWELLRRGELHDLSKLQSPEIEALTMQRLKKGQEGITYNSDEYKQGLKDLDMMLAHHYANNRHHPQHFKNGIDDMNLVDLNEMFADWKASSEIHNDGNLRKSIEENAKRFNMNPQLVRIFENSVDLFA